MRASFITKPFLYKSVKIITSASAYMEFMKLGIKKKQMESSSTSETSEYTFLFPLVSWFNSFGICIYAQHFFDAKGDHKIL